MTLSALICCKNEQDFVKLCLDHIEPYVDEVIFVDNQSTDASKAIAKKYPSEKIKVFSYPPTTNMGEIRQFSLDQATGDWIIQVDCDEIYTKEDMLTIRQAIENPGNAISFRVGYHNLAWKPGFKQANFEHYPDRIYRRDVIDRYDGILPNDMTKVKREFFTFRPFLEYDNPEDRSFENPVQPILPVRYYHLARTRGHHFEYTKWRQYNRNIHPTAPDEEIEFSTLRNVWVSGEYPMEPVSVPEGIPTRTIPSPKVSVIVTCYQKGKWICHTLNSILNQTVTPFEVIVVNDGSTDDSNEKISLYLESIIYINQENQGVTRARNNGLMKATGDYFILIDGDDALGLTYIERCLAEMTGDTQIVYTDFQGMGEWDWVHHYPHPFNPDALKQAQVFPSVMALCDMRLRSPYGNFQNFLAEDFAWWVTLVFERGANVKHIPEPLCYYRRTTGTRVDEINTQRERANQELRDAFGKYGVNPQ